MWVENIADRPELVLPVAQNMRQWDRTEIFATRGDDSDELLSQHAVLLAGDAGWVAGLDRPIAAFGCVELWPGVRSMWLFATDEFGHIGLSMTKLIVRSIVPMLFAGGAHRLEARSIEGNTHAQDWLELIGARREGSLKGYGRDGQTFHTYAWEHL